MSEFAPGYIPDDTMHEPTAERPRLVLIGRERQEVARRAAPDGTVLRGDAVDTRSAAEIAARIQEHNAFLDNELTPIPEWEQADIDARERAAADRAAAQAMALAADSTLSSQGFLGSVEGDIHETKE